MTPTTLSYKQKRRHQQKQQQQQQQQKQKRQIHEQSVANTAPIYITSYLNTLHIRHRITNGHADVNLNATITVQWGK